jgi:mono/diheme cytochrome c family protein
MKRMLAWTSIVLMPFVVIGGLQLASRDVARRTVEWPTQMLRSPAAQAFEPSRVLPRGSVIQPAVAGTVARGQQPFRYAATPADAERAGRELVNPLAATGENLARGRAVFVNQCAVCHGARGKGDGPIVPKFPNPPSFHTAKSRALADGTLFHVITLGRNTMPAHAALVPADDRWRLVHFIRALQREG